MGGFGGGKLGFVGGEGSFWLIIVKICIHFCILQLLQSS